MSTVSIEPGVAEYTRVCTGLLYGTQSGVFRSNRRISAFLPTSREPISSSHSNAFAPSIVAMRSACWAGTIKGSIRQSLKSPAARYICCIWLREPDAAAPSQPRATVTLASIISGYLPIFVAPLAIFSDVPGQKATLVPASAR